MTPRMGESAQEIAARYEAIAPAGLQVTVCPPKTFSEGAFEPVSLRERQRIDMLNRAKAQASGERKRRLARVLELADGTRSTQDIAEACGVAYSTAKADLAELRKKGHACHVTTRAVPALGSVSDKVRAMVQSGCSDADIAARWGVTERTAMGWRLKLGLGRTLRAKSQARQKELMPHVRRMALAGKSDREIADALGLGRSTVGHWRALHAIPAGGA